jgi:hypothetical protein
VGEGPVSSPRGDVLLLSRQLGTLTILDFPQFSRPVLTLSGDSKQFKHPQAEQS